jgi:hypothetical protein
MKDAQNFRRLFFELQGIVETHSRLCNDNAEDHAAVEDITKAIRSAMK